MKIYILKADAENSNGTMAEPYLTQAEALVVATQMVREWDLAPLAEHEQVQRLQRGEAAEGRNADFISITEHDLFVPALFGASDTIKDMRGALSLAASQIEQMKGMFEGDESITNTLNDIEEAETLADRALQALKEIE